MFILPILLFHKQEMTRANRILLCALAILAITGAYCVGMSFPVTFIALIVLLAFLYGWFGKPAILANVMLLVVSSGFVVVVAEVVLRATLTEYLYYRPHEMFIQSWPRFPEVARYKANASVSRGTFGDLAAMSEDENLRETRSIDFITDSFGFRNKPLDEEPVYDILLLGDSFTVGNGTTQESTWATLLSSRYNLQVYNLAIPGSPWQSYVNLAMEMERLDIHPGTTIILAIFSGNDLDESYGPTEITDLPLNDTIETVRVALSTYRNRSVIMQLKDRVDRASNSSDHSDVVLVKEALGVGRILFYKPYVERKERSREDILKHRNYSYLEQTLSSINDLAIRHSANFKIILIPTKAEIYSWVVDGAAPWSTGTEPSGFSTVLRELSEADEIEYLDIKPFLLAHAKDEYEGSNQLLWWLDDTHWNVNGHSMVADVVYNTFLKPSKVLPNQSLKQTR